MKELPSSLVFRLSSFIYIGVKPLPLLFRLLFNHDEMSRTSLFLQDEDFAMAFI